MGENDGIESQDGQYARIIVSLDDLEAAIKALEDAGIDYEEV